MFLLTSNKLFLVNFFSDIHKVEITRDLEFEDFIRDKIDSYGFSTKIVAKMLHIVPSLKLGDFLLKNTFPMFPFGSSP